MNFHRTQTTPLCQSFFMLTLIFILSGCGGADSTSTTNLNKTTQDLSIESSLNSNPLSSSSVASSSITNSSLDSSSQQASSLSVTSTPISSPPKSTSISSIKLSSSKSITTSSKTTSASSKSTPFTDRTPPNVPSTFEATFTAFDQVSLAWSPATDNVGVAFYKIYRDNTPIDTLNASQNNFIDFDVAPSKNYVFGISVGDAAGNWSPIKSLSTQTLAAPQPPSSSSISSSQNTIASSVASLDTIASSSLASSAATSTAAGSAKSSTFAASSKSSSAASSRSSTSPNCPVVSGSVTLCWFRPTERENGNPLALFELSDYKIRYKLTTDIEYTFSTTRIFNDATFAIFNLNGDYEFQIAACDTTRPAPLCSSYTTLTTHR